MGKSLHTVYPRSTLDRVLRTGKPEYNVSMSSLKDVRVLSDRLPLYGDGRPTGAVGIFRNRTEVTRLADDLTGVRHMVDAMRAYTHEFMNKLHVILGLLQIGEPEKAPAVHYGHQAHPSRRRSAASCTRSESLRGRPFW